MEPLCSPFIVAGTTINSGHRLETAIFVDATVVRFIGRG